MATKARVRPQIAVERPASGTRGMASEVISARARAQGAQEVPLVELIPNPRNPRDVLTEIEDLAADMRAEGVLQPLLVCSREAFLAGDPEREADLPAGAWVILAGARRYAAAIMAELDAVPVHVRDDLAGPEQASRVFQQENGQRVALTPMQEARMYGDLRDRGHSQRQIAERVGVSHGQVAKRLKLLVLPTVAQQALVDNDIDISAALVLADTDSSVATTAVKAAVARKSPGSRSRPLTGEDLRTDIAHAERKVWVERMTGELNARGIEIIDHRPLDSVVVDENQVDQAPLAELRALLQSRTSQVFYYRLLPDDPNESEDEWEKVRDAKAAPDPRIERWHAATEARVGFITGVIAGPLDREDKALAMKVSLRLALSERTDYTAKRTLHGWMEEVWGLSGSFQWEAELDENHLLQAVYGYTLARTEVRAVEDAQLWLLSGNTTRPDTAESTERHFARLTEKGYVTSPIESELLAALAAAMVNDSSDETVDEEDSE